MANCFAYLAMYTFALGNDSYKSENEHKNIRNDQKVETVVKNCRRNAAKLYKRENRSTPVHKHR